MKRLNQTNRAELTQDEAFIRQVKLDSAKAKLVSDFENGLQLSRDEHADRVYEWGKIPNDGLGFCRSDASRGFSVEVETDRIRSK